jgi:hypothetical protein
MKKKRLALIAVLPLTIAVILGVSAILPPRAGVTKANFERVQDGMTLAEVEGIFGEKARHSTRIMVTHRYTDDGRGVPIHTITPFAYWIADADEGSRAYVFFRPTEL